MKQVLARDFKQRLKSAVKLSDSGFVLTSGREHDLSARPIAAGGDRSKIASYLAYPLMYLGTTGMLGPRSRSPSEGPATDAQNRHRPRQHAPRSIAPFDQLIAWSGAMKTLRSA
jgi:hypothetical protein